MRIISMYKSKWKITIDLNFPFNLSVPNIGNSDNIESFIDRI